MVSLETPVCDFGKKAPDFNLLGVDGENWNFEKCGGDKGTLVMFICNHCPYVKSVIDRIVRDTSELQKIGVNAVAIMSNNPDEYAEDSFENMQKISRNLDFSFPYLIDSTQSIAREYGAVCTPDFFGYNSRGELQYRGRLDESRKQAAPADVRRDLFLAMQQVAQTGHGPKQQIPSMGCSIKWY